MLAAVCLLVLSAPQYDLVIRGGTVVDGTGKPGYLADVAVKDDRIAAVGSGLPRGKREIAAKGMVVAPGFIDVHLHAEDLPKKPRAYNLVGMGVTTIVTGNCGSSRLDVGGFLNEVRSAKPSVNVATLIGHNDVRGKAMGGTFNRPPTAAEMNRMKSLVDKGMREGALGLSTGLIYDPGVFSTTDEIVELARAIKPYNGIYTTHMRSEGDQILEALDEAIRVGREAGVRVQVSHLKLGGPKNWGRHEAVLDTLHNARAEGLNVAQDQYLYTAASTSLKSIVPEWARDGGNGKLRSRLKNPEERAQIVADMKETLAKRGSPDYQYVQVGSRRIPEIARSRSGSDSLDAQIETVLDLVAAGPPGAMFHGIDEADLREFLKDPHTMIASDGGAEQTRATADNAHPRGYGNCARVLGRYVRSEKLLSLEEAVRRMTWLPASTFRLANRGQVKAGRFADLVVFDPQKVADKATYDSPRETATGFRLVLVNGVPVVENDRHTGRGPGKALRRQ